MIKVKCADNRTFYDIDILKNAQRPIDELFQYVIYHHSNLPKYYQSNSAFKELHNVTLQLVLDFKLKAVAHIEELKNNLLKYGTLYHLAQTYNLNRLYIEYTTFPLINIEEQDAILKEIQTIALESDTENSLLFNITCLELLYFFALIVNPDYNWITIDYLSYGNKNHQYTISADTYMNHCHQGVPKFIKYCNTVQ